MEDREPSQADLVREALTGGPPLRGRRDRTHGVAIRLTSYVSPALALELRHAAVDRGETVSDVLRRALEEHLAAKGASAEHVATVLGLTTEQRARLDELLLADPDVRKALR